MSRATILALALVCAPPLHAAPDGWWRQFGDPLLDTAVDHALAGNFDLTAAAARVEQSRALERHAHADMLPSVDLGASAEADRMSLHTPFGVAAARLGFPRNYELYQGGASAHWELDLFGGLSARRHAAAAQSAATQAQADGMRLLITVQTADAVLHLRGIRAQIELAQQQQRLSADLAALVRQRASQGLASDFDANRAQAASAAADAALAPLRAALAVEIERIGVLTGGDTTWRTQAGDAAPIPAALAPALDADPAQLMRRRPDLVAAEAQVLSARAEIAVARAEYYPHLSLGGLIGLASLGTTSILANNSVDAQGSAALRWRLFDFGRVDAEVAAARGHEKEALATWRQAALTASAEVADAIVTLSEGHRENIALLQQVTLLTRARAQAGAAYGQGVVALIDVLEADRALIAANAALTANREALARASVAAVAAMGGGYGEGTYHG